MCRLLNAPFGHSDQKAQGLIDRPGIGKGPSHILRQSCTVGVGTGVLRPGPRAITRSVKKSYSGRRSSASRRLDFFFIGHSFFAGCLSRAN